ncbi:MAG: hypothetical protein K0Q59_6025 [Paenibacillus sp.]|jgi:hypothetical protein|nr:hypothetical protein [Paenibacillus sp.]
MDFCVKNNNLLGGMNNVSLFSTILLVAAASIALIVGLIYSIRSELRYRERMRKEMEEIRRTRRL